MSSAAMLLLIGASYNMWCLAALPWLFLQPAQHRTQSEPHRGATLATDEGTETTPPPGYVVDALTRRLH